MSRVRVDEEVEIPRREWYHLIDLFTRLDELLEILVKEIETTNKLLRALIGVTEVVAPPTPEVVREIIALPFRVRLVRTDQLEVTDEKYSEILLSYDVIIMTTDVDVLITASPEERGFLLTAGAYLVLHRSPGFSKMYVMATVGKANIYVAYFEVER